MRTEAVDHRLGGRRRPGPGPAFRWPTQPDSNGSEGTRLQLAHPLSPSFTYPAPSKSTAHEYRTVSLLLRPCHEVDEIAGP